MSPAQTPDDKGDKKPSKDSKRSTREKAQAAREAAEREQRRRDNRIRVIGGIAIAAAVLAIVGLGYWGSQKSSSNNNSNNPNASPTLVASAALPTGVAGAGGSYPWSVTYKANAGKPTLAIWEDFQCPICGALEQQAGASIRKFADDGKVTLIWRPTAFLDTHYPDSPNPGSSVTAGAAWGCAIDAGKLSEFHSEVYANQPQTEGDGWTQQQLLDFGKNVGITGDAYTKYEKCVKDSTYTQWINNSYATFISDAVSGTPTGYLNGTEVPLSTLADSTALGKLIDQATAGK